MNSALSFCTADDLRDADVVRTRHTLPPTPPAMLNQLAAVQSVLMRVEQIDLQTEHTLHGGMYARTIRLKPGDVILGALIKCATLLVVNGSTDVLVGDGWTHYDGYNVLAASAGRQQLFVARGTVEVTMVFPTKAKTVAEAEDEFTDMADLLTSRKTDGDLVTITGE